MRRRQEQGYNLVILMVAVTVLSIMLAAVLPVWSTAAKREREEELIFRGLQYAEAIRLFQQRFGRLPVRLEELAEVEPRCIRKLWEDPITGKRDWRLVRGNVPVGMNPGGVEPPQGEDLNGRVPGNEEESAGDGENLPDGGAGLGPIRGVRSRSTDEALKVFFDKERYDQWLFTVDLLQRQAGAALGGDPYAAVGVGLNARWLGRPFLPGVRPIGGPMAPDQQLGGGLGPPPPRDAPEEPVPDVDKE